MYPAGGPNVPAAVPSRRNHVGWVMFLAPAQYTSATARGDGEAGQIPRLLDVLPPRESARPSARGGSDRAAGP